MAQILGPLRGADDDGRPAVAFETAIEQPERVRDHARGLMILDRDRLGHHGVAVEAGVVARGDRDLAELTARRAVKLHVPTRHRGIELRRRDRPDRHLELADELELRHLLHTCADPSGRGAIAPDRQQDVIAEAGADRESAAWMPATQLAPPSGVVAE